LITAAVEQVLEQQLIFCYPLQKVCINYWNCMAIIAINI
jgi:hypothetical protein